MPEQQAPSQINPQSADDYLEVMSKAMFQSGISWRVVEAKWSGIRQAFKDFDAEAVSMLTPDDVDDLVGNPKVIRNRRKIEAVVANANHMLELESEHGSFRDYLNSHDGFESTVADLRKRFKFLGDTGAYYFLHVVGESVPSHEEWMASRGR